MGFYCRDKEPVLDFVGCKISDIVSRFERLGEQVYYYEARKRAIFFCATEEKSAVARAERWVPKSYNGHLSVGLFRIKAGLKPQLVRGWVACAPRFRMCMFDRHRGWIHQDSQSQVVGSEFEGALEEWIAWLRENRILEKKEQRAVQDGGGRG